MFDSSDAYNQQQQQLAMQSAIIQAQQLANQAAAIQTQTALTNQTAINQRNEALKNAITALDMQKIYVTDQYTAEKTKQDALANQYHILLANGQALQKNMIQDQKTFTSIAQSKAGEIKSTFAGQGIQANKGSVTDITKMMVNSVNDAARNSMNVSLNEINKIADQALATQTQAAQSLWALATNVSFQNQTIKNQVS